MKRQNFQAVRGLCLAAGLLAWGAAPAVDAERLQRYQAITNQQKATQGKELEQARAALRAGNLEEAERRLGIARHLAFAPDEVGAVEREIGEARERLAREERERQERIAREEERERQEKERIAHEERAAAEARASAARVAATGSASASIESHLDYGYHYNELYIPPVYETKLRERGIFFREYYLETTQSMPGYTMSNLEKVYFSVRLRNPSNQAKRVTYKIRAREEFSVGRAVGNTAKLGIWTFMGGLVGGALLGQDGVEAGALVGGAWSASDQQARNEWFEKEKSFSVTLGPGEESYETGSFPVNKRLSQAPALEIVSVE